ncbi:MAG: hypothetical protein ABIJ53_00485, partial [Verrucomicrobiota bacterium]
MKLKSATLAVMDRVTLKAAVDALEIEDVDRRSVEAMRASLTIQDYERLCPEVNRRSLQRDLKTMVDMGLLISEGATNKLVYRMKGTG